MATATHHTEAGVVLGTAGYMSPEQVRGVAVDARSDIFAFGAILYEMLSGKRAFHGETAADTMSAILKEDPPDLSETNRNISPALERIVQHCLEKNPESRFHSASDIAFDLEHLSGLSGSSAKVAPVQSSALKSKAWLTSAIVGISALATLAIGWWLGGVNAQVPSPNISRSPSALVPLETHASPRMAASFTAPTGTAVTNRCTPRAATIPERASWD